MTADYMELFDALIAEQQGEWKERGAVVESWTLPPVSFPDGMSMLASKNLFMQVGTYGGHMLVEPDGYFHLSYGSARKMRAALAVLRTGKDLSLERRHVRDQLANRFELAAQAHQLFERVVLRGNRS